MKGESRYSGHVPASGRLYERLREYAYTRDLSVRDVVEFVVKRAMEAKP